MTLPSANAVAAEQPRLPGTFELKGSNGYTLSVWSAQFGHERTQKVFLRASRPGSSVTYLVPGAVTETSIQADFGGLGKIDVRFSPSGVAMQQDGLCGEPYVFDSGLFEGTIRFRGERGYTEANATQARGYLPELFLNAACRTIETSSPPGAALSAKQETRRGSATFSASKERPRRRARFTASTFEKRGEMEIIRSVEAVARSRTFTYGRKLQTATVAPPAPFVGRAFYRRKGEGASRWTGALSVDLPGRPDVKLVRAAMRVNLVRDR